MAKRMAVTPLAARRTVRTRVVTRVSAPDISRRAYALFQERGQEHGRDVEDWLRAEAELLGDNREWRKLQREPRDGGKFQVA